MNNLKRVFGVSAIFALLVFSFAFASAINLELTAVPVAPTIINDGNAPAVFDITLKNNDYADTFQIYTFERFKITPENFSLGYGETKTIRFEFMPLENIKKNVGYLSVPLYFSKIDNSEYVKTKIEIKLVDFSEIFDLSADNINLDSDKVKIYLYNVEDSTYDSIQFVFSSEFMDAQTQVVSLKPYEKKEVHLQINSEKLKKLVYGEYSLSGEYTIDGRKGIVKSPVKILEKSGISTSESSSGIIVHKNLIEKKNEGNVPTIAEASARKNIVSRLFTTLSPEPVKSERKGFFVYYTWQKELQPAESLNVVMTTNWMFPLLLILTIAAITLIFNAYMSKYVVITKRVNYIKTKSNDFALKVTLHVKAKKFVEKVSIYDRVPAMTKLYEQYGTAPSSIDKTSGRIKWTINHLGDGEERIFTYIVYSKLKIVGRFELPVANVLYEKNGKMHEASSNRAFFINEPKNV